MNMPFTRRITTQDRVIIPKSIRDCLDIRERDMLVLELTHKEKTIRETLRVSWKAQKRGGEQGGYSHPLSLFDFQPNQIVHPYSMYY